MTMWSNWLSALGLVAGAGMGAYGLINPRWAANLVRLRDDPVKPGGYAEFRATYGGLYLASHGVALWLLARHVVDNTSDGPMLEPCADMYGALFVCGAMWIGAGLGRIVSILRDGAGTKFNQASVAFELGLGLVILAPPLIH